MHLTTTDKEFSEFIQFAWNDFNNPKVFTKGKDILALITSALNRVDFYNLQWLLTQAQGNNADEFHRRVKLAKFGPSKRKEKLEVIRAS